MKKGWLVNLINKPLIKGVLKTIPVVGDIVSNIDNGAAKGELDEKDAVASIIRAVVLAGIVYLFVTGKLDIESAEAAKDLISQ